MKHAKKSLLDELANESLTAFIARLRRKRYGKGGLQWRHGKALGEVAKAQALTAEMKLARKIAGK